MSVGEVVPASEESVHFCKWKELMAQLQADHWAKPDEIFKILLWASCPVSLLEERGKASLFSQGWLMLFGSVWISLGVGIDQFAGSDISGSVWELCNIHRCDTCMPASTFLLGLMLPSAKV